MTDSRGESQLQDLEPPQRHAADGVRYCHSLRVHDRLRRFMPGGRVNIRFNLQEPDEVHVNGTFPTGSSPFIYAGGFLLALLAGILSVTGELVEAVARFRK